MWMWIVIGIIVLLFSILWVLGYLLGRVSQFIKNLDDTQKHKDDLEKIRSRYRGF